MTRKNTLTRKEKLYVTAGLGLVIIILIILGLIAYNNLFKKEFDGKIQLKLEDSNLKTGEHTKLIVTVINTGKEVMTGTITVDADDKTAVNITYPQSEILLTYLHPGESITRIFNVTATTNAIRTDFKITGIFRLSDGNITSNEVILTVTRE